VALVTATAVLSIMTRHACQVLGDEATYQLLRAAAIEVLCANGRRAEHADTILAQFDAQTPNNAIPALEWVMAVSVGSRA